MSSEFSCKVCDISCSGQVSYDQHLQSAKHLKKARENESSVTLLNSDSYSPQITTVSLSLTTNNNISEDASTVSASLSISPETMRILLEWNHPLGYKPYCDICQLPLHGGDNAELHFRPSNVNHNQKLAAWKQIQEDDAPYSCKVCSEIFTNENTMRDHFDMAAHQNMKQERDNLKKFIQIYQTYEKLKEARIQRKESKTMVDDSLSNQFEELKVIDETENKITPKKSGIFNADKFHDIMKNKVKKDYDD